MSFDSTLRGRSQQLRGRLSPDGEFGEEFDDDEFYALRPVRSAKGQHGDDDRSSGKQGRRREARRPRRDVDPAS